MIKHIYTSEIDISRDDGPGINEREFVNALLDDYPDDSIAIVPYPEHKKRINRDGLCYFYPHKSKVYRYPFSLVSQFLMLRKILKEKSKKTVIMRLGMLPIMAVLVKFYPQVRLHLKTLAGYYIFEKSELKGVKQKIRAFLLKPIFQAALNSSDRCDTVSYTYIKWFYHNFKINKNKLTLIVNGVNTEKLVPLDTSVKELYGFNKFKFTLGYVGALAHLRNLDTLILSLKHLEHDYGLVIVGTGPEEEKLKKLVYEEDLTDRVVFTGAVPYNEVPALISSFDLPVDFSKVMMKIGSKKESASFSQKIPQYLSMNKPVIAWDTPDTTFLKKEKLGATVIAENSFAIAEAIKEYRALHNVAEENKNARQYAIENLSMKILLEKRINWSGTAK